MKFNTDIRRKAFASTNGDEYHEILMKAEVGYLGLIDRNGFPRIVPLNFVLIEETIYFHGARAGEKFELFKAKPKVAFSIDIPYSFIPSYFHGDQSATSATIFFKSVHIRGNGSMVNDLDVKAMALQRLMEKHQPEGQFVPITPTEPIYQKDLQGVGIYQIIPQEVTMKLKFGQNLSEEIRLQLIEHLKQRNMGMDSETIKEIEKTLNNY